MNNIEKCYALILMLIKRINIICHLCLYTSINWEFFICFSQNSIFSVISNLSSVQYQVIFWNSHYFCIYSMYAPFFWPFATSKIPLENHDYTSLIYVKNANSHDRFRYIPRFSLCFNLKMPSWKANTSYSIRFLFLFKEYFKFSGLHLIFKVP